MSDQYMDLHSQLQMLVDGLAALLSATEVMSDG